MSRDTEPNNRRQQQQQTILPIALVDYLMTFFGMLNSVASLSRNMFNSKYSLKTLNKGFFWCYCKLSLMSGTAMSVVILKIILSCYNF